ncbi:unnamed protein product [Lota lota]
MALPTVDVCQRLLCSDTPQRPSGDATPPGARWQTGQAERAGLGARWQTGQAERAGLGARWQLRTPCVPSSSARAPVTNFTPAPLLAGFDRQETGQSTGPFDPHSSNTEDPVAPGMPFTGRRVP